MVYSALGDVAWAPIYALSETVISGPESDGGVRMVSAPETVVGVLNSIGANDRLGDRDSKCLAETEVRKIYTELSDEVKNFFRYLL